jgi:3-hydroxyacyl-CoA dehydrogenase/enoyl-CoA hydratase/3-hydroxybutyryl-CoA epimerase/enoyl-CoA isomerase
MVKEYDYIKSPEDSFCKQLYENNTLGQKTGAGFYSWKGTKRKEKFSNSGDQKPSPVDVENRLMSVMTKEAKTILNEKIVDEPYEINMAMIFGTGYPPYKEGLV